VYIFSSAQNFIVQMVVIHLPLNTYFDRQDIQNCKNVNRVSVAWTGVR